jgi:hypothetical protein
VVPSNFNNNFKIALNKLKQSDGGIDKTFNDIYIETSTLGSYDSEKLKNKKVSLWTRKLSEGQKNTLQTLYYDVELSFNEIESEIHIFTLNYFNDDDLEEILQKLKGKQMMFYYQNQKYHSDNNKKDKELENQLNYYKKIIGKYTNYSWWTYIRHFIINN